MATYSYSEWFDFYGPGLASDSRKTMALDGALNRLPAAQWGGVWDQAVALLALHMIASSPSAASDATGGSTGVAGPVTGRSAGGLSESYGAVGGASAATLADAELMRTTYGQQYLSLRASRVAGRMRVADNGV